MLLAGAAKASLDMGGIIPLDGFGGLCGELLVRALVVEGEDGRARPSRVAIVSVDATSLKDDLAAELRATVATEAGIAVDSVWVAATHSFSVPHVRTPGHIERRERTANSSLADAYVHATRTACRAAVAAMREALPGFATGAAHIGVCRDVETPDGWWLGRDDQGPSSPEVPVFVLAEAGRPIAVVFSADVQPAATKGLSADDGARVACADLAGFASVELERRHPGCVALWLEGAAGDQAPALRGMEPKAFSDGLVLARTLGLELADAVDEALAKVTTHQSPCVRSFERAVVLPGQCRRDFKDLRPSLTWRPEPAPPVTTTVSLLRIGPATLVGVRPELSCTLGARLRHDIPDALVATLVNGSDKYLPDERAYDRAAYEAMNSGFGRGSSDLIHSAIMDLVTTLAQEDDPCPRRPHERRTRT